MSPYGRQVELALRAVAVTSATSYAWLGRGSRRPPPAVRARLDARAARAYLVSAIAGELYRSFYCHGRPVARALPDPVTDYPDETFVDALSEANGGRGGWDGGWRVVASERGELVLERDGLRVRAGADELGPGDRAPGDLVAVLRDKEHRGLAPGYYSAIGDAYDGPQPGALEVRVYVDVSADGAPRLVGLVCDGLNRAGVPFVLKVLDHPRAYVRRDAAVLYLHEGDFERAAAALRGAVAGCAAHIGDGVPAFTKALACGVGVGEHRPAAGTSFGSVRCRLVAEGIVAAHERGARRIADGVVAVERAFAGDGLRLELAHLARPRVDRYAL